MKDLFAVFTIFTSVKALSHFFVYIFYVQIVAPVVRASLCGKFCFLVTEIIGDVDTAVTAFWPAVPVLCRASFAVLDFVRLRLAVALAIDRS